MSKCVSEGCELDIRGCVTLDKILQSFGAPISEEQAWALCYTIAICYHKVLQRKRKVSLVKNFRHVILNKEGYIHDDTFLASDDQGKGRHQVTTKGRVVAGIGVLIYHALEYTLRSDEERELSPALYCLIDRMTSAEPEKGETDDEGIERDSFDSADENCTETLFTMHQALVMCEEHFASGGVRAGVEDHYRAVVRAMIAEALDLTLFLRRVAEGVRLGAKDLLSSEQDLQQLHCEDWARLWNQVMKDLRDGVKLKKVEYTLTPLEYTLTPYEMLMEDIRSRRYTLNKVMVDGDIPPRVKKDAHSIILDFIRSRPPLKKASERQLAPLRKVSNPIELLMESIRNKDHRLRHVASPVKSRPVSMIEPTRIPQGISPQPKKKLISFPRQNLFGEDDDDDDDLSDIPPSSPRLDSSPLMGDSLYSSIHTHASLNTLPTSPPSPSFSDFEASATSPLSRVAFDLAKYGGGKTTGRRHSISICESTAGGVNSSEATPLNSSGMSSRGSPAVSPQHQMLKSTSKTQRDFLSSSHFSSRLDCLALTLEEVVHIRNVLTKADLESLPLDLSIKEDMARSKICFLCMKVRFGFFSPRGSECKLCKRVVCKKCVTKMRIPTEHFSNIPVIMLTPQALSPKEEDEEHTSLPRTFLNMLQFSLGNMFARKKEKEPKCLLRQGVKSEMRDAGKRCTLPLKPESLFVNLSEWGFEAELDLPKGSVERQTSISASVGSAPASPSTPRAHGPFYRQPTSTAPCVTQDVQKKQELRQRNMEICERLRGQLMSVCLDCKAMVIHVLLSIKLRKDQKDPSVGTSSAITFSEGPRSHLHLNLTPVYI